MVFKRVPVGFNALYESYQRIFYALEAMGQVEHMHRKVFDAIHQQRQRLDKEADIAAFMTANGVDGAKFLEPVQVLQRADQGAPGAAAEPRPTRSTACRRWACRAATYTSGSQAGSNERALAVDRLPGAERAQAGLSGGARRPRGCAPAIAHGGRGACATLGQAAGPCG